ncbi:MAG TPA: hypothetical protein VHS28_06460, partial [Chloroflexota bacterium]|nr:hypothetical protein [Chloroflexota bacterium]
GLEHKIVMHGGGGYGDKPAAMERLIQNCLRLPAYVRRRLILENDERLYTVADMLAVSERTDLPVVIDWLHDRANPSDESGRASLARRAFATWKEEDGIPEVHFSSQKQGSRPGSHSEYVDAGEFLQMYEELADLEFDCELEAKAKDLALLSLRQQLSQLPLSR